MADDQLHPEDIIAAYRMGFFPMADDAQAKDLYWYDPPLRGQLDILTLHIPDRLRKTALRAPYEVRVDTAFAAVIDLCAAPRPHHPRTWINTEIRALFIALHQEGHAHSVECWRGDELVGGLYGLAIGGLFAGESMFSRADDASKIALLHLCARLHRGGFTVLDTQMINDHLRQFGAYEITRAQYQARLEEARDREADFGGDMDEPALLREYLAARG